MKFTLYKNTNASKLVKRAQSKQSLTDYYWNSFGATVLPDFDFDEVMTLIDTDPVASGAVQHFVDKVMEGEWSIVNWKTKKYDEATENKLRYEHKFDSEILRMTAKIGKLFKNVFLEIVREADGVTPKAYNILDSKNVDPQTKPNGDAISYKTKKPNPSTGEYGEWSARDIIWMKFDKLNNGWAPVDIKALYTVLLQKRFINRFISWAWQTGQYRVIHNFKTINDDVVQDFIAYNSKVDNDFTKPFLASGDYTHSMLRDVKEFENIEAFLKYLDNQILILLRVPPIDAGVPDASGRSNADAQSNSFNTHINSFKQVIKDGVNEMFRKVNKGTNAIVFGPSDRFAEKMVFDVCLKMKQVGFTDDAIEEYLFDKGMVWATKQLFEKYEDPKGGNKYDLPPGNNNVPEDLSKYPSRETKADGEASQFIGAGQEASTRQDQLTKRSFDTKRYYTYDAYIED